jgi:hypothetical protein
MFVLRSTQRAAFALVALGVVATVASGCHSESKASPDPTTQITAPANPPPKDCGALNNGDPHYLPWRQCMGFNTTG